MEHIHTFIISVLLAGIISFFPSFDKATAKVDGHKTTIRSELIQSWLHKAQLTNTLTTLNSMESFGNRESFSFVVSNNELIIDLPERAYLDDDRIVLVTPKYWEIVHSIESKQGKRMYRPKNTEKSCKNTNAPCGHFQISAQALKDIGCNSDECKTAREDLNQSLSMSKSLEEINLSRLANKGYSHLPDYQKYLIHQQGATGIRNILDATNGRYEITKTLMKNMSNNSSFSYKKLKSMGSKIAAKEFLNYWENKWQAEMDMMYNEQYKKQMAIREYLQIASNLNF